MKKLLMVLSILVMSVVAFADGTSCNVRGDSGQVTLLQENAKSDLSGCVTVYLERSGNRKVVNVMIKVYDAFSDKVVKVESVTMITHSTDCRICGLEKEHTYYFRISDAHCG